MVCVLPATLPLTTRTGAEFAIARALHRMMPKSNPHFTLGNVTCQNVCQPLAPSVSAACS